MFQLVSRLNRFAVVGMLAVGAAITISSFSVVRAELAKPDNHAVYSCASGTACVEGSASGSAQYGVFGAASAKQETGVYGEAISGSGVAGITKGLGQGVFGESSSMTDDSAGVSGESYDGPGVIGEAMSPSVNPGVGGESAGGFGVYGASEAKAGVYGESTKLQGVYGVSKAKGQPGVRGENLSTGSGYGGYFTSAGANGSEVLFAAGLSADTDIFFGVSQSGGSCLIDHSANLTCSGSISSVSDLRVRQASGGGQHVIAYAAESTTAAIEDFGEARMVGGRATVRFDRDFASTIDPNIGYLVFLTPMGDTRGLYVRIKTPAGFEVRETEGGRSTLLFDYRIIARPLGANGDRLPQAPPERRKPALLSSESPVNLPVLPDRH